MHGRVVGQVSWTWSCSWLYGTAYVRKVTLFTHYSDVIMGARASQITSVTVVYLTAQMASNAEMYPFEDVILTYKIPYREQWIQSVKHQQCKTRFHGMMLSVTNGWASYLLDTTIFNSYSSRCIFITRYITALSTNTHEKKTDYIDGLMQYCCIPIANALEILQSWT